MVSGLGFWVLGFGVWASWMRAAAVWYTAMLAVQNLNAKS